MFHMEIKSIKLCLLTVANGAPEAAITKQKHKYRTMKAERQRLVRKANAN